MRKLGYLLPLILLAVVAGAVARWSYVTSRPDYRLRKGQEALRKGDGAEAERLMRQLDASGHAAHAHLLRGEANLRRNDYVGAVQEFRQVGDDEQLRLEAAPLLGRALLPLDPYEAEKVFRFVLEKDPDNLIAHRGLADIYHQQHAEGQAKEHLEQVARLDPADGRCRYFLGLIERRHHEYDTARAYLEQALALSLNAQEAEGAREELILCLFEQRQFDRALQILETCNRETRENPDMQRVRADCLWERGRRQEACASLDRALALHPQSTPLLRTRARFHLAERQPKEAIPLLERALSVDPHDLESRHRLAMAYQQTGQAEKAGEQVRLAKRTSFLRDIAQKLQAEADERPWDAAVRRNLARVCRELGRNDQARIWEKAAAACSPAPWAGTLVVGASTIGLLASPDGRVPLLAISVLLPGRIGGTTASPQQ